MHTIAGILDGAARAGGLNAPRVLQSWPGIVHGGGVVALLDAAAARLGATRGPRALEGRLTASLPLETDLGLAVEPWEDGITLTVLHDGQVASSGTVRPLGAPDVRRSPWPGGVAGAALPTSDHCLACGAANPLGLRVTLRFDDEGVWARLTPPPAWRAPGGAIHPALAPVLLDEVAWWLGALVAGEGGLTNRVNVALIAAEWPGDQPIVAAGRFADVAPIDRRRAFWRTEPALLTSAGVVLATAAVVFRGGAEYSARQIPYFRSRTDPAAFARMFPRHLG